LHARRFTLVHDVRVVAHNKLQGKAALFGAFPFHLNVATELMSNGSGCEETKTNSIRIESETLLPWAFEERFEQLRDFVLLNTHSVVFDLDCKHFRAHFASIELDSDIHLVAVTLRKFKRIRQKR
jgi:hypothetical protein